MLQKPPFGEADPRSRGRDDDLRDGCPATLPASLIEKCMLSGEPSVNSGPGETNGPGLGVPIPTVTFPSSKDEIERGDYAVRHA
jgi:hypothetical protein